MTPADRDLLGRISRRREYDARYETACCAVMALLFAVVAATILAFGPAGPLLGR